MAALRIILGVLGAALARTNQGTPAPAGPDESQPRH